MSTLFGIPYLLWILGKYHRGDYQCAAYEVRIPDLDLQQCRLPALLHGSLAEMVGDQTFFRDGAYGHVPVLPRDSDVGMDVLK